MPEPMELAYVAHSERCALLLDEDGICRWFVLKVDDESAAASAQRCIGAQFVASLDPEASGLLGHEPSVGKNVLLARVDDGHVSLVRFGPLVQFDTLADALEQPEAPPAAPSQPALDEPQTGELPRLMLVPAPPMSEPATLPGASAFGPRDDDRETEHDLFAEDELVTACGEHWAYRPSGVMTRAQAANEGDNIETTAFTRAALAREWRRGVLPRRR